MSIAYSVTQLPLPSETYCLVTNVACVAAASAVPPSIEKPDAGHTLIVLAEPFTIVTVSPGAAVADNVGP
jgi:hypothetical protein